MPSHRHTSSSERIAAGSTYAKFRQRFNSLQNKYGVTRATGQGARPIFSDPIDADVQPTATPETDTSELSDEEFLNSFFDDVQ